MAPFQIISLTENIPYLNERYAGIVHDFPLSLFPVSFTVGNNRAKRPFYLPAGLEVRIV
jgi:hypothetical protein